MGSAIQHFLFFLQRDGDKNAQIIKLPVLVVLYNGNSKFTRRRWADS